MATVTSNQASAGVQPKGLRVGLVATTATYSPNGSMSSGDVIQMVKVPQNSTVVSIATFCVLQGQGSYIVGDGVSTSRYVAASTASVAALTTLFPSTAAYTPYVYSTDDTIDIVISASTNFSAGAIYMIAVVNLNPTV